MKKTKRSLFISIVTLLLCSAMFVGSTFAWFTDTVSNTGNKIQAGTLKIGLEQYKPTTTHPGGEFVDISGSGKPIFYSDKYEPGYSDVALLKVTNEGNLALKYVLNIKQGLNADGSQSALEVNEKGHTLADAIWVYSKVGATADELASIEKVSGITDIDNTDSSKWHKTLLKDALAETDSAVHGVLLPEGEESTTIPVKEVTMAVILHMDEQAGNEYQGLSLGTSFDIELRATQYAYEEDGFDSNDYDALADGNPDHPEFDVPSYPVTKLPIKTVVQEGGTTEVAKTQTINLPSGMSITYQEGTPLTTIPTTGTPGDSTNKANQGFEFISDKPAEGSTSVIELIENDPNKAVAQYKLTLPVAQSNDTLLVKTTDKIVAGYINLKVFHNGNKIAQVNSSNVTPTQESFYYNPETGDFTLWVYHSSPIEFVYDKEYLVVNQEQLEAAFENQDVKRIKIGADFDLNFGQYEVLWLSHSIEVDFCGHTIEAKGTGLNDWQCAIMVANNPTSSNKLTFVDSVGGGKLISETYGGVHIASSRGSFELNDVTIQCKKGSAVAVEGLEILFNDNWTDLNYSGQPLSGASIIMNSGKIILNSLSKDSGNALHIHTHDEATEYNTITLNGGEIEVDKTNAGIFVGNKGKLIINSCKFTQISSKFGIFADYPDAVVEVKGGTFVKYNPEEFVPTGYKSEKASDSDTWNVVPQ